MDIQHSASIDSAWSDEGSATTPATMASISSTFTNAVDEDDIPESDQVHVVVELPHPHQKFSSSMESQLQESTLAPTVFRKHLKFAKTEDKALTRLYDDIDAKVKKTQEDKHVIVDKGSKTNLLHMGESKEDIRTRKTATSFQELDLTQRISLEEVISSPSIAHAGKLLLCLNATLPVVSHIDGEGHVANGENYVITTVLQESENSAKAVRLEIRSNLDNTEDFFHMLRYPYLNNLEPGSLVAIRNPTFAEVLVTDGLDPDQGTTFSIRARHEDVDFLELPSTAQELFANEEDSKFKSELDTEIGKSKASLWVSSACEVKLATEEWKQWGGEYSVGRLHSQALFAYNIALRFDPDNVELASARSTALINLGYYSGAMRDVELISSEDPFNSGYILRKVNCLWGLERYHDAIEFLRSLLEKLAVKIKINIYDLTEDVDLKRKSLFIQSIIFKTEKMLGQKMAPDQTGSERYFKGSSAKLFYDEPEYYKPIEVVEDASSTSSSKSRPTTVLTNQKVAAGKLLVITKAFSVTVLDDASKLLTNHSDELINQTLQKMCVDRITESVLFKKDILNKEEESREPLQLTKTEVKLLAKKYYYSGNISSEGISPLDSASNSQFPKAVGGIWTFPMNIRHACVGGNAIWYTVGNLMFIRAIRDLGKGEEVVMPHVDPTKTFEVRSQLLAEKGLSCYCPLCQFEKSEPEHIRGKRTGLLNEMRILTTLHASNWSKEFTTFETRKLHLALEDLTILRSAYAKLNFPIVEPLYNYGTYLMTMNKFEEAINQFEKAFFVVDNTAAVFSLINISLHLAYCNMAKKRNDKGKAKKWFSAVKTYAMLSYGCLEPVKANFKYEFEYLERKGVASLKML